MLAGVVAGGPLGFLPEGAGEGVGVGGHGAGQAAVGGIDAEVAGEVVLGVPGGGADRGRLGRVEDGGVAFFDAAQHPLVRFLGRVPVEDPAGGGLAGRRGRVPPPWRRAGAGPRSGGGPPAGSAAPADLVR